MAKIRELQPGAFSVIPIVVPETDPVAWLTEQAGAHGLTTLLAHADDGVIWGQLQDGVLVTSDAIFGASVSPPLSWTTLQQARLFGSQAELLVWRMNVQFQARLVQDVSSGSGEYYDEFQMLWGTQHKGSRQGFTLVADGKQGHQHALPLSLTAEVFKGGQHRPLRLQVRHYLQVTEAGLLQVALSRLVTLNAGMAQKELE